jgi:type I restriction enzyme S subunit
MVLDNNYSQLELMQARVKLVPEGWAFNYVGKVFAIKNNLRKPINEDEREKNPGVYPYYGPTKIQGYIGSFEQDGCYALIGEDGDHFLKYDSQSMTQLVDGKCTVNNHAHIIEGTKKATREWFYYYFMHRDIFSFLSRQGAGRYKLNKASLEKIPVLVPPLPEQKKIAQILSTWDQAITTTEQLLANSQQQKKALMQQLLTGKKRLLDKNGVRFSGEWVENLLGDISKITTGSSNRQDSHMNGAYTFFDRSEDIRTSDTYLFDCEAVIVPGEGQDFVPKYFVGKFDLHQRTYAIMDFSGCNGKFLFYAIYFFRSHFLSQAVGSTVKSLRLPMFQKMKLSIPDIEEQQKIASVLTAADAEIDTLKQKLDHLKQEKKALMQQLLTGKRRVKVG